MIKSVKLLLFFLGYQLLSAMLMVGISCLYPLSASVQLGWSVLLANLFVIFHLLAFRYLSFKRIFRRIRFLTMVYGIGCIVGMSIFSNALSELFPLPDWMETDFLLLSKTFLGMFSLSIIGPFAEELMFRGAIMNSLAEQGYSSRKIIWISALIFGLIHFNPAQVPFAILMGLVFGWVTWKTHSLCPVILGHILNNTVAVLEMRSIDSAEEWIAPTTSVLLVMVLVGLMLSGVCGYLLKVSMESEN